MPEVIDGISGDKEISEMLAKKFGTLYNSLWYDPDRIKMVENSIHNMIEENINDEVIEGLININELNNAIKQIKSNKSDRYLALYYDHMINGIDKMYELLVKLYNDMLTHGCSPPNMLVRTLCPIPKYKIVNINISDNFRAVCLQSV